MFMGAFDKVTDAITKVEQFESHILDEIGFAGPSMQFPMRIGEALAGSAIALAGVALSETGVGIPIIGAGLAIAADGVGGMTHCMVEASEH
jgi:hypothetical protein